MALQRERDAIQQRIGGQIEELQRELILLTKLESERLKLKEESDKVGLCVCGRFEATLLASARRRAQKSEFSRENVSFSRNWQLLEPKARLLVS